jgi:hypothetical protein
MVADLNQTSGDVLYTIPTQGLTMDGNPVTSAIKDAVPFGYRNTIKSNVSEDVNYEAFEVQGYLPHGCLCIPFGDQKDPGDWYDASGKSLVLKIKAGELQSGDIKIVNQQLRSY